MTKSQLDDLPVLVVFDRASTTSIPYSREVGGRLLTFYQVDSEGPLPVEFVDVETGSRWNMQGEAVAGPLQGERLRQIPAYNAMWFAWSAYWPETELWAGEGILETPAVTAVEDRTVDELPLAFELAQNHPNPFNPSTHIRYQLPSGGRVNLAVYTPLGQKIRTLVDEVQASGLYAREWDGLDESGQPVASGVYFYRLEMPEHGLEQARTMSLLR